MRKIAQKLIIAAFFLILLPLAVSAEEIPGRDCLKGSKGFGDTWPLADGNHYQAIACPAGAELTLQSEEIGSLYLIFSEAHGEYQIIDNETGETREFGSGEYYHEFADLQEAFGKDLRDITLRFPRETKLCEVHVFTPGEVPDWVQKWTTCPDGEADLMLISAHGDDEQLFMGGVLPEYAGERGMNVQVVYLTNHFNFQAYRIHEMLDGLWACGVRQYPVFGPFRDIYSMRMADAYSVHASFGETREVMLDFFVEQLRRFRPMVAITHDVNGEYGHAQHQICADLLMEAVSLSSDPDQFPETAEKYGTWDVPKTYLHLYPENPIVMDWDQPLEAFDGMTAFQVCRDYGFPAHASQVKDFAWYYAKMERAADIPQYSPCQYGLFRSTVGEDREKNDFFENVMTHAEEAAVLAAETETQPETTPPETTQTLPQTQPTTSAESTQAAQTSGNGGRVAYAAIIVLLLAAALLLFLRLLACLRKR